MNNIFCEVFGHRYKPVFVAVIRVNEKVTLKDAYIKEYKCVRCGKIKTKK